ACSISTVVWLSASESGAGGVAHAVSKATRARPSKGQLRLGDMLPPAASGFNIVSTIASCAARSPAPWRVAILEDDAAEAARTAARGARRRASSSGARRVSGEPQVL